MEDFWEKKLKSLQIELIGIFLIHKCMLGRSLAGNPSLETNINEGA